MRFVPISSGCCSPARQALTTDVQFPHTALMTQCCSVPVCCGRVNGASDFGEQYRRRRIGGCMLCEGMKGVENLSRKGARSLGMRSIRLTTVALRYDQVLRGPEIVSAYPTCDGDGYETSSVARRLLPRFSGRMSDGRQRFAVPAGPQQPSGGPDGYNRVGIAVET